MDEPETPMGQAEPPIGHDHGTHDGPPIVECVDVHKWYGVHHALRGIDLTVHQGEVVVIFGPSGSGKSTLIRTINRLEEHQRGRIVVDGIGLTTDVRNIAAVRREVGMVFQRFNLFPHLTALGNVMIGLTEVRGRRGRKRRDRDRAARARRAGRAARGLPGGAVGWPAAARRHRAGAGDEPQGDAFRRAHVSARPRAGRRGAGGHGGAGAEGMTMVVVTHEMGFARRVADRVVMMDARRDHRGGTAGRLLRRSPAGAHQAVPRPDPALRLGGPG